MKTAYLVRHGDARGSLTERGVGEITRTAAELRREIGSVEDIVIYHSTLERARESAKLISLVFNPSKVYMEARHELDCNTYDVGSIVDKIDSIGIIVSHQPDLESYLEGRGIYSGLHTGEYRKLEF